MKVIKDKLIIERDAYHYYFERIIFKIPLISMFFHLGEWQNDRRHGKGTLQMQNGDIYQGDWSEGEKNGQGQYEFANNDLYEGYWLNGKRHGKGVYRWNNGETYNGDWKNDRMNGQGVRILSKKGF